jgi:hypothetical protein
MGVINSHNIMLFVEIIACAFTSKYQRMEIETIKMGRM